MSAAPEMIGLALPCIFVAALALVPPKFVVPQPVYFCAAVTLAAANAWFNGWATALLSLTAAAVLFVVLVLTRLMSSRRAVYGLAVAAAGIPVLQWWVLLPGLLLAALVAAVQLRRTAGAGYVTAVTGETFAAIGATSPSGVLGLPVPDLNRLPVPSPESLSEKSNVGRAHRTQTPLLPLLATGMTLSAAVLTVLTA